MKVYMVKYLWGVAHVLRVEFLHPGSNQIALWTLPTNALLFVRLPEIRPTREIGMLFSIVQLCQQVEMKGASERKAVMVSTCPCPAPAHFEYVADLGT